MKVSFTKQRVCLFTGNNVFNSIYTQSLRVIFKKNKLVLEEKAFKCFLLGKAQACSLFSQDFFPICMFIFVQQSANAVSNCFCSLKQ